MLHQISEKLVHRIKLWYLVQHSLVTYQALLQVYGSAELATQDSALREWAGLPIHANHKQRASDYLKSPENFIACLQALCDYCDFIIADDDDEYPDQLKHFDDRSPLIFGQGDLSTLTQIQIAVVGSRKVSAYGEKTAYDFAYQLAEHGFYITSGLATGIDTAAHQAGLQFNRTIAVIGSGLNQIYPTANRGLHHQILQHQGAVLTEFLPNTPPLQHHFPRRNRIISGLSLGTLVIEAAVKSGSLSTARWAMEQGKPVFAIPGHFQSEYHKGCHVLIREGATLVDEPSQIIEELRHPLFWQKSQSLKHDKKVISEIKPSNPQTANIDHIPSHLQNIYQLLDFSGVHIDELNLKTGLAISDLTAQLIELELLGLCLQRGGLYLRA